MCIIGVVWNWYIAFKTKIVPHIKARRTRMRAGRGCWWRAAALVFAWHEAVPPQHARYVRGTWKESAVHGDFGDGFCGEGFTVG